MFHALNNNNWRPTADRAALEIRAEAYQKIRNFFAQRGVLEVETPMMCARGITDPYIQAYAVSGNYLQTSPEYAMKRMLAAGFGSIYQICKVFRQEEAGNMHNPEFTMLEWYRVGFDHHQLMDEMDELIQLVVGSPAAHRISYQQLFIKRLSIDPLTADIASLQACAEKSGINLSTAALKGLTVTDWLQILMSHLIEPSLIGPSAWMVYDFPAAQAALAKVNPDNPLVAARFEVYMQGIELANGYYELQDANEQARRFAADNELRTKNGTPTMQADERLLSALQHGMPDCAGVALGLDRLLMVKTNTKNISKVMSFTIENA